MDSVLVEDFERIVHSDINFQDMKNSSFLITGATGLLGSLLVKFLLYCNENYDFNFHVYALVRNIKKANEVFKDELDNKNLSIVVADLLNDACEFSFYSDYVIHTAAVTTSKQMVEQPVETIFTSIYGLNKILQYAADIKARSIVYLSSMEVYGQMHEGKKVTEEQLGYIDLTDVRSCYPESKRVCECICSAYAAEKKLNVKSIRLAQTFGAGIAKTENRVFAQFARSALKREDIVLHTRGLSEGNYIYTSDALSAIFTILLKGQAGQVYNVNNEESHMTIREMAQLVLNVLGAKENKIVFDIPKDKAEYGFAPDVKLHLDPSKVLSLGWRPQVDLKNSYIRLARWIKANEGIEGCKDDDTSLIQ